MFRRNTSLKINSFKAVTEGGVDYLVVSGVPIREQVLNDYYVPAEEINKFIGAWNGVPVTINHPTLNNGSANVPSPDVAVIGRFYNATWDGDGGNRLVGEYWIDVTQAMKYQQGKDILSQIKANTILETSTGYWADEEVTGGEFDNRKYSSVHHHLRPDHIAIFPDGTLGACSNEDGCGVNLNSQKKPVFKINCGCDEENEMKPILNDVSFSRRDEMVRRAFYTWTSRLNNGDTGYVSYNIYSPDGIFEDYIILETGGKLYKVDYTSGTDGYEFQDKESWEEVQVDFSVPESEQDSSPVVENTQAQTPQGGSLSLGQRIVKLLTSNKNSKENNMKTSYKLNELFSFLAGKGMKVTANEQGDEPVFEVVEETEPAAPASASAANSQPNTNGLTPEEIESLKKLAGMDFSALLSLPAQVEPVLQFASNQKKQQELRRNGLIMVIKANESNTFTDEELTILPDSVLEKLSYQNEVDFSGMGGGATFVNEKNDSEGFLALPNIVFSKHEEVKQ